MKSLLTPRLLTAQALLSISTAFAAELDSGVPVPSPVGNMPQSVLLQHVHVNVQGLKASLRYELENQSDLAVKGWLSIYSPLFAWEGSDATYPDKSVSDLRVQVGAKQISLEKHVDAYHFGRNVNGLLAQAQLDPLLIAQGAEALIKADAKKKKRFRNLVKENLLSADEAVFVPNWYVLVSHNWAVELPPHASTDMRIEYDLKPAFEPLNTKDPALATLLHNHCSSTEQISKVFKSLGLVWPEYGVVQQYQIPIGLGSAVMPLSMSLDFVQEQRWSGLMPRVSVVCQDDGTAAIGTPFLKTLTLKTPDKPLSVLVFLPQ